MDLLRREEPRSGDRLTNTDMEWVTLDEEYVEALRTTEGGFTKALTDELGIPYPYRKGWLAELKKERREVPLDYYFKLQGLSTLLSKSTKKKYRKIGKEVR